MTRKEFIKMCGILGIGIPLQASLKSCSDNSGSTDFEGKVIVIGAGAAGLAAGYFLQQQGIDYEIVEASSVYGGRMKRDTSFADFPIPLGAEWLHVGTDVFAEIVNDSSVNIDVTTIGYDQENDVGLFEGEELSPAEMGFTIDRKFVNSTWFDFFEEYIVPSVQSKIRFNTAIQNIDYSDDTIRITTADGEITANKVIMTAPLKILQLGLINFMPALPNDKQEAIDNATVWDGFKAFIEFSEKFYETFTGFTITPEDAGQKLYYDAAYGQDSDKNILGLFSVGTGASPYLSLSDDELRDQMLSELDEIYDGKASASYVKHISQNWNNEPFIQGAYLYDNEDWQRVQKLAESVDDKIFFAGAAYGFSDDWSSVHTSAQAAKRAVEEIVG
ncbi:MAG: FAD-dependent oxidoreductase [Bacteroidota bacterium]